MDPFESASFLEHKDSMIKSELNNFLGLFIREMLVESPGFPWELYIQYWDQHMLFLQPQILTENTF